MTTNRMYEGLENIDPTLRVRTFVTVERVLDELISKLAAIGLNVHPSRLARYRKTFRLIRELAASGFWPSTSQAKPDSEVWNDVHEVYSLQQACSGFGDFSEPELKRRLQKVIGGHPDAEKEGEKSEARNILFELIMASWLSSRGLSVTLPPQDHEDVRFVLQKVCCYLECKRVQTARALPKRLKDAEDQLRKRLYRNKSQSDRGVIALDVSKSLVNSNRLLQGANWDDTGARFQGRLKDFVHENAASLMTVSEQRIFAVFVFSSGVGVFPDGGFMSLSGGVVFGLHSGYGCNKRLSLRFRDAIGEGRSEKTF